jgi:hypothetical protein
MTEAATALAGQPDSTIERERKLSAEKYRLFAAHERGELSFDELRKRVYEIDHKSSRLRSMLKLVIGAFLPLLFVGRNSDS